MEGDIVRIAPNEVRMSCTSADSEAQKLTVPSFISQTLLSTRKFTISVINGTKTLTYTVPPIWTLSSDVLDTPRSSCEGHY